MKQEDHDFNDDGLFGNRKQSGFDIPEGYFDKLPLKIQNRISKSRSLIFVGRIQMVITALRSHYLALGMTLLILLIGLGILLIPGKGPSEQETVAVIENNILDERLDSMVKEVVKENVPIADLEPIEQDLVIEEIRPEAILPANSVTADSGKVAMNSSEEINYLLENDIDVSLIIEELNRD